MDTNYLKTGNLTVNDVEIGYGIRESDWINIDPYVVEFLSDDGDLLGDLPMNKDDYECLDLIDLGETVFCAAESGMLPEVADYCNIQMFGGE